MAFLATGIFMLTSGVLRNYSSNIFLTTSVADGLVFHAKITNSMIGMELVIKLFKFPFSVTADVVQMVKIETHFYVRDNTLGSS